ncbi:MAG: hypothetical protein ED556_06260 [Winogradskyella sp.]|uniref:DUF5694 domain-containing protein n=1 Tax=Winogradskyella sp. TaxID=1883156 RepID=UPI000F3ECE39|nr:DUF5694 domain-containing protein [Winogradskyella sp.]RNC87023.1 MAG: hypothetical protein ED556_06260 [Winogradskyella sp.]
MLNRIQNVIVLVILSVLSCESNLESKSEIKQTSKTNPVKVYLLGTFHFAQTDSTYNVLDAKHQTSIEELCKIISNQKPDKVFLERQPEYEFQNKINTLYDKYKQMNKPLKVKNEIFQVGFRVAKQLKHDSVYLCDHPGRYGSLNKVAYEYAQENNQNDVLERKRFGTIRRQEDFIDEDSLMQSQSLLDYIRWLNSDKVMDTSHASYITNWPLLGSTDYYNYDDENTLLGAEVIADWYRRNILIYTKMINQVDYANDDAIVLIMGGDHIPIIKNLFDTNPYFEVIPTDEWLAKH